MSNRVVPDRHPLQEVEAPEPLVEVRQGLDKSCSRAAVPGPLAPALTSLASTWRTEAARLHRYGAEAQARVLETVAEELEGALRAEAEVPLTLEQAATESGYSADHLRHLIASGTVANAGRRGAPRVRRGDLPKRPRPTVATAYDPDADALRVLRVTR